MICLSVYITKNQFIEQDYIQGQNATHCFKTQTNLMGGTNCVNTYPATNGREKRYCQVLPQRYVVPFQLPKYILMKHSEQKKTICMFHWTNTKCVLN